MTSKALTPEKILLIFLIFISGHLSAQPYYVSLSGSDLNDGSLQHPFRTIEKAVTTIQPGQIIYVRGGTYDLTTTISLSKSGASGSVISLHAYAGEKPLLNFSGQALSTANRGIVVTGSYWHIRGFDITGAGDNGMIIYGGSNNLIENCSFFRNRDSGLQLSGGASNNTVRNCDSYFNADPPDYGDADGFAPKMDVGSGNSFYGCRSWRNCDDGWDGYLRGADDISTIIENCWAFENGYFEDGSDAGANANGNGFKMGGSDDKQLMHNVILKNCLAFTNKAKGFDQNNNKGSMTLYNCTGHGNVVADYRITQYLAAGKSLILKNCIDLGKVAELGTFALQEKNSWLPPFVVTAEDFISTVATAVTGPRKADGTLPDITYMHLAAGSDLIDAGTNVGLPYSGSAPDLGCFEVNLVGIRDITVSTGVKCYPNPISDIGELRFAISSRARIKIRLFDITGKYVKTLYDQVSEPGEQRITISLQGLPDGMYVCRIMSDDIPAATIRLVKTE